MSDNKKLDDKSKYEKWDENHPLFDIIYPKGLGFEFDLTPVLDLEYIQHIKVPEDRWFTKEEFREIFVRAYKLSKENIDDMKKWDKEHGWPDRFEPRHNGFTDKENRLIAHFESLGDPVLEKNLYDFLTGKIHIFELKERDLHQILYKNRYAGRKRYKKTPELVKERKDGINNFIKTIL